MKIIFLKMLALSGLLFSFSMSSASNTPKVNALQVTIQIYSGRPNPVFIISDPKEIEEILKLATGSPLGNSDGKEEEELPILGYNGIEVINVSNSNVNVDSFIVKHSKVLLKKTTRRLTLESEAKDGAPAAPTSIVSERRINLNSGLEERLLALGKSHGAISDKFIGRIRNEK